MLIIEFARALFSMKSVRVYTVGWVVVYRNGSLRVEIITT